jgi:hypothetical protein
VLFSPALKALRATEVVITALAAIIAQFVQEQDQQQKHEFDGARLLRR